MKNAALALGEGGVEDCALEARIFLADELQMPLSRLFAAYDVELSETRKEALDALLRLRLEGEPLQYIQGRAYFMGHEFIVDRRVLIPRQDTELLCELAIDRIGDAPARVADICTGCGAIAISIALKCPNARVFASDISPDALIVARENALRLNAPVEFARGDFLSAFEDAFDLIVCNPPYLSAWDMKNLQKEVTFEPALALYGGEDGLDFYKRALVEVPPRLKVGGMALFEVGMGQARVIHDFAGSMDIRTYKDLNGIERIIEF
ncbi:MAG: peptide chain release factor N(5)-glutamine methyltransferase, partial [Clostridia bacterium]|nr:peptide chain release factor N(5)-glutamine methyltransferase [Clostridia bacterium]